MESPDPRELNKEIKITPRKMAHVMLNLLEMITGKGRGTLKVEFFRSKLRFTEYEDIGIYLEKFYKLKY